MFTTLVILTFLIITAFVVVTEPVKIALVYSNEPRREKTMETCLNILEDYIPSRVKVLTFPSSMDIESLEVTLHRLNDERIDLMVGPTYSTQAYNMLPLIEKYRIFALSPTVTSPAVLGKSRYFYSISLSDVEQSKILAEVMTREVKGNVLIVASKENYVYSMTFASHFLRYYEGGAVTVIPMEGTTFNEEMVPNDVKGILLVCDVQQALAVMKVIRKMGLKVPVYGSDYISYGTLTPEEEEILRGVKVFVHFDVDHLKSIMKGNTVYSLLPPSPPMDLVNTIDALRLMVQLYKLCGDEPDRIVEMLHKNTFEYMGIGGKITMKDGLTIRSFSLVKLGGR